MQFILQKEQSHDNNNSNNNNNNNNNNLEESYTQEKAKYERSGWAMFTRCAFDKKKINLVFIEERIILKNYVKIKRVCNENN